jgi:hypothetical protein
MSPTLTARPKVSPILQYCRAENSADRSVSVWAKEQGYPVTDLYTSHYISNLIKFGNVKNNGDGTLSLITPIPDEAPLPNFAVEQTGGWVVAAFNNPDLWIGMSSLATQAMCS